MDIQIPASQTTDKFQLWGKWFWIGIVMSFLNAAAGLIYGIALAIEKDHRKEGLIIIGWAIVWTLIVFLLIGPLLVKSGYLLKY